MKPLALVLNGDCGRHDTGWGHPEHQGRLPAIVHAIERDTPMLLDHVLQHEARHATKQELLRVHTQQHIDYVRAKAADAEAAASPIVVAETDTLMSAASWDAALAAAGCVVDGVGLVMTGKARTAIALGRPPGHHATPHAPMGFCLFNNVAVGVRAAQADHGVGRVLIVDWDVHHGNGTQDIFYDDPNVFFLSLHLEDHYPGTGAAHETGVGAGIGTTLNLPLPAGLPPEDYLDAFESAVARAFDAIAPELVMVSAGYDCMAGDPLGGLLLEPPDLYAMTRFVLDRARTHAQGRVVVALEGGYAPRRVAAGVVATMRALAGLPLH